MQKLFFVLLIASCAVYARRIVGGAEAPQGQIPFQVAWVYSAASNPFQGQFCGGTLISDEWVLTAAHCFRDIQDGTDTPASSVYALLDTVTLENNAGKERQISQIVIHPSYIPSNAASGDYIDVALIKITPSVSDIRCAKVCDSTTVDATPGTMANVSGWGSLDENSGNGARFPTKLNWVEIPLVDLATCNSVASPGIVVTSDYICAGYLHHDSCQGDSGGPLFLKKGDWDVVIGIVSSGTAAQQPLCTGVYGTYTRVCAINDWITTQTGDLKCSSGSQIVFAFVSMILAFLFV